MDLAEARARLDAHLEAAGFSFAEPQLDAAVRGFLAFAKEPIELDDPKAHVWNRVIIETDRDEPSGLPWHDDKEPTVLVSFARYVKPYDDDFDHEELGLLITYSAADVGRVSRTSRHCDNDGEGFDPRSPDDRGGVASLAELAEAFLGSGEYATLSAVQAAHAESYG